MAATNTTETILIIGGSFAGIGAAHHILKHVLPALPKKEGVTYNVTMVNPSKDLYWRFASPRAIVSNQMMPHDKLFYPIEPAFTYAFPKFKFIHGTATHVDPVGMTVSVTTAEGEQQSIPYISLVIATGFTTPSPLFTQATDAAALKDQWVAFEKQVKQAKTVVIGGGGPVGVETAGEVAEILNGKPGFMASAPKNPKAQVTLVCADKKLLPVLREAIGQQAQGYLKRLGCEVTYNTRVVNAVKASEEPGAKTNVELSNGKTIEADIYIDATGTRPNSSFLPKEWLDNRNKVNVNSKTLRVENANATRVYAVGDVASAALGGVMDQYLAIPAAMTNLKTDLIAHLSGKPAGGDRHYEQNPKESQICPVGTQKGVGAFNGFKLPSQMVWFIKGRDYLLNMVEGSLRGDQYKNEGKWHPVQAPAGVGASSG